MWSVGNTHGHKFDDRKGLPNHPITSLEETFTHSQSSLILVFHRQQNVFPKQHIVVSSVSFEGLTLVDGDENTGNTLGCVKHVELIGFLRDFCLHQRQSNVPLTSI